jgi:hypothetical protein
MRAFDRDLIRGGHYGQRPCVPRLKAEHMAAPTIAANVKKALANSEPSTGHITDNPTAAINVRLAKSGHRPERPERVRAKIANVQIS